MSQLNVRPLGTKVLVAVPMSGRSESGVWVVGSTPNRMDAVVVSVGRRVSPAIEVGRTVVVERSAGLPMRLDDVDYRLVDETDIVAANVQGAVDG